MQQNGQKPLLNGWNEGKLSQESIGRNGGDVAVMGGPVRKGVRVRVPDGQQRRDVVQVQEDGPIGGMRLHPPDRKTGPVGGQMPGNKME